MLVEQARKLGFQSVDGVAHRGNDVDQSHRGNPQRLFDVRRLAQRAGAQRGHDLLGEPGVVTSPRLPEQGDDPAAGQPGSVLGCRCGQQHSRGGPVRQVGKCLQGLRIVVMQ
jgi:hypothetical protein